ncbi:MAG TPA: RHS repeat-associated core domain-containing protein [Pseudonocardiaceae bacterium]
MAALVFGFLPAHVAAMAAAAEPAELSVPYGSGGWRYKVVGHGAEPGFEQPAYADVGWATGTMPFGNAGCAGTPPPVTSWPLDTDLLVRRALELNPATLDGDLSLKVAIDNDVDVFFNGVLIASNDFEGCGQEKARFDIPRALAVNGTNTLAVRAIDRGAVNYLDLELTVPGGEPEEPPVQPHDPVANAGADRTVAEGSVVTLDGSGSQAGLKPVLAASERAGALPGGTSMGVRIEGLDPDAPVGELRLSGQVNVGQGPAVTNTSIAYVVDVSGSTNDIVNCGGDANGDRRSGTVLDCEVAAVIALHQRVVASGTVAKVGLISFNSGASARDLDPTSGSATLIAPDADRDGNGVLDLIQVVRTLRQGGGTAFAPPTRAACQLLATSGSRNLVAAFMSDGEANDVLPTLPCNPPVTFQTFAVGAGSSCTFGSAGRGLDDIALRTGGTCRNVPNVEDLPDILPGVIASRLTRVTYTVDDAGPVDISADLGLPREGPVAVPLAVRLPSLALGTHRICVTVTGTDSGGESGLTTCSDLVMVTGELSYQWRVVSADGPPVVLTAGTGQRPSFVATDDGTYVFELEVTDGLNGTATDQVSVTVENAAPAMTIEPGEAYAGGVTQVNGTFTDPGWVDTHTATLDWGDGTTQQVPVSVQGSGWGTFFGSHVYRAAATYQLRVTLTDDDGGEVTQSVGQLLVRTPVAVWANSTAARSLSWGGAEGAIQGRVHTNGELRFVGAPKTVIGGTTYAGSISADTTRNSFDPAPAQTPVQQLPVTFDLADHRPGGPVAAEIGPAYHDMTVACAGGTWHEVQAALPDGVYYAPCPIQLNGSDIGGRVTLVSESTIKISGSRPAFEPYLDGLLLLAGSSATKAIDVATSSSKFLGVIFAGTGQISISGAGNRFYCGILGDRIEITGGGTNVRGAVCGRPDSTVSGPVLVPDLTAGITVDRDRVLPSQTLGYDLTVTNDGATLVAPALVGLENVDTMAETVDGYDFALERLDAETGQWEPLATTGDDGFRVDLRPNPFPGVTYPADGGVGGTTVAPGGWATWGLQAVLDLTPDEVVALLDPAETAGIRTRVDFQVSPGGAQARRLYTYGSDFIEALRALSGDVADASATFLVPSGDAEVIGPDAEAGLGAVAPGRSVTVRRGFDVPVVAPRGAGETDAGYLSRLKILDGTALTGGLFVLASGGVGRLVAPLTTVTSHRSLPVVKVTTSGPTVVTADTSADYTLELANVGSGAAGDLVVEAAAAGTDLPVTAAPTALAAGELATAGTTYRAHATPAGGTIPVRGTATWTDSAGNTYGESGSTLEITEQTPARLRATLADMLVQDAGSDGATSPGDTLRYTLIVRNTGDATMSGVTAEVRLDANTAYVDGSGVVQNGTVTHLGGVVSITLPDVLGNTARTATIDVTIDDPFPLGLGEVSAQGTVRADGQADALTDDVTIPGPADPTATPVIRSFAALSALLSGRLVIDADGNGTVTAGDTIAYQLEINSVGTQTVTGINLDVATPQGTTLVAGSVETTQGAVAPGEHVAIDLGQMGPLSQNVVQFRLQVDNPLAAGITAISTQARLVADQLTPQLSDDPVTAEVGDPTVFLVGRLGGGPGGGEGGNGPVIGEVSPAEGTIATEPVHVTATLTPPDGQTLDAWVVDRRRADDTTVTVLASGTGSSVDALLDPTVMPNGTYVVTIRGTTSVGGLSTTEITVVVDGQMKLGRYTTTYDDLSFDAGAIPVQVLRTYDSFDKSTGDFGVGWSLDIADFQVSSNGPLGDAGWTMQACGGGLIFVPLCFTTSGPHFVTVTWPDGHNEIFDLTPAQGSTFFPGLTTAKFTGRAGTTSKLQSADNSLFFSNGNLNGGPFGINGVYNPKDFVLTDRFGTSYNLRVGVGLTSMTDRRGNTVTVDQQGIHSSTGPDVLFHRDGLGRITRIEDPDGAEIRYGYDAAGDLISVTDRDGRVLELTYVGNHYLRSTNAQGKPPLRTLHYAGDGRLESITDGAGNTVQVDADPTARTETVTGPDPRLTTITTFDDDGNVARQDQVFDGRRITNSYAYNNLRLPTVTTDGLGHRSVADYDAKGNLTRLVDRDGVGTDVAYNDKGSPTEYRVDGVLKQTFTYDPQYGDLLRVDYPDTGLFASFRYDSQGRVVSTTDAGGQTYTTAYDANGHPDHQDGPEGRTDATYSAAGKLISVTDPTGDTTEYGYDGAGRLTSVEDGRGRTWTYTYDEYGQLWTETDPLGKTTRYTYDAAGRARTAQDRNGIVTTLQYGPDSQVTRRSSTDGSYTAYTYDALGRLASAENATARLTYTWDDASRPVTETLVRGGGLPDVTLTRGWTDGGELASIEDPQGRTTYTYDGQGRLGGIADTVAGGFGLSYDNLDRLTELSRPNGATTTWTYRGDRIASQVSKVDGNPIDSVAVEYDATGFPRTVTDAAGVHTYTHDGLGRLTAADHPADSGLADESYSYDRAGNRSAWAGNPAPSVTYDDGNRLLSDGTWTYDYDDEGRLVSRSNRATGATTTFAWNSQGDLTSARRPDGSVVGYGYDPLGRRIETTDANTTWRTVFAGENPLLRSGGGDQDRFVHGLGPDGILSETENGRTSYPIGDAAGTVRALTDGAGQVTDRFTYDSFGNPASGSDVGSPHGFHGFEQDPIGMYDARARTYDPSTGRFISEDPLPAVNLYPYALNSPLTVNDPSGMAALVEYKGTTQQASRNAQTFCAQGAWTASLLMDVATEVAVSVALSPLAGQSGLYAFWDADANKAYVGRSVDLLRRINEHLSGKTGKKVDLSKGIKFFVGIPEDVLASAEQLAIERCNGGKAIGKANQLANKINAINKTRRDELSKLKTILDAWPGY